MPLLTSRMLALAELATDESTTEAERASAAMRLAELVKKEKRAPAAKPPPPPPPPPQSQEAYWAERAAREAYWDERAAREAYERRSSYSDWEYSPYSDQWVSGPTHVYIHRKR